MIKTEPAGRWAVGTQHVFSRELTWSLAWHLIQGDTPYGFHYIHQVTSHKVSTHKPTSLL